jgi:hypothetical protein
MGFFPIYASVDPMKSARDDEARGMTLMESVRACLAQTRHACYLGFCCSFVFVSERKDAL